MKKVSVIIPAYNEADRITATLRAVRRHVRCDEVIVVDDGSEDATCDLANVWADRVIRHAFNQGKGAALKTGWTAATGDILLFLDADLQESAGKASVLLTPLLEDRTDMAIAVLPGPARKVGFGLAKGLARKGIQWLTGFIPTAPLSGQRAVKRDVLDTCGQLDHGFGIEVGLTIDALRAGFRVEEIAVDFTHRETGNNWSGYFHRGREFYAIGRTLGQKWKESVTNRWG